MLGRPRPRQVPGAPVPGTDAGGGRGGPPPMWHIHWHAAAPRRGSTAAVEPTSVGGTDTIPGPRRAPGTRSARGSFQRAFRDSVAAAQAGDVPESVRVRGR